MLLPFLATTFRVVYDNRPRNLHKVSHKAPRASVRVVGLCLFTLAYVLWWHKKYLDFSKFHRNCFIINHAAKVNTGLSLHICAISVLNSLYNRELGRQEVSCYGLMI